MTFDVGERVWVVDQMLAIQCHVTGIQNQKYEFDEFFGRPLEEECVFSSRQKAANSLLEAFHEEKKKLEELGLEYLVEDRLNKSLSSFRIFNYAFLIRDSEKKKKSYPYLFYRKKEAFQNWLNASMAMLLKENSDEELDLEQSFHNSPYDELSEWFNNVADRTFQLASSY